MATTSHEARDNAGSLHLPGKLRLTILDAETELPVAGIAVALTVFAREKNDYHLGLPISDAKGRIQVTSDWVQKGAQFARDLLISDYATPLRECKADVDLEIMSVPEIEQAVSAMRIYGLESGAPGIAQTVRELQMARNQDYKPRKVHLSLGTPGEKSRHVVIKIEMMNRT